LIGTDKKSVEFQRNIRSYNTALAFTSLGVKLDDRFKNYGIPTFSIQGKLHHRIGSLLPSSNNNPQFAQLYFYDSQNELDNRMKYFSQLDKSILKTLQELMHRHNPYVRLLKQRALEMSNMPTFKLVLKDDPTKDRRVYNLPSASEVAVLLPGLIFMISKKPQQKY
jgi:hypothetical protein